MEDWWQNKFNNNTRFIHTFKKWETGKDKLKIYKYIKQNFNPKAILNIGCGTGLDFILYNNYFKENNISWKGIEYSSFMVDEGKKQNIPIELGNILNLKQKDSEYECLLVIDVFEHLVDIKTALHELFRVSNKIIVIAFFKIPQPVGVKLILNKHINNKDLQKEEIMTENTLFLVENPKWRKGFTKGCFYNYHNKNYIEDIIKTSNYRYEWVKYEDSNNTCLLIIYL